MAFLAVLPLLFVFRGPVARFAGRHLHVSVAPRTLALGAPVLSLLCGGLLIFYRPPEVMIQWRLDAAGISVQSLNGAAEMKWSELGSAALDPRNPRPDEAALVLTSKDGRELWLVLAWLTDTHREKVLGYIRHAAPGRFNRPVPPGKPIPAPAARRTPYPG
jgi:hypothetical protein